MQLLEDGRQLLGQDALLVFQVLRVGLSKVSLMLGPLDVSLHKVRRLLEFFILLGEGLHPLYQLTPLLGSPSYPLQKCQDYEEQSPMSKRNIIDAVLTLICFITPARVDSSLFSSLVVSSSSTATTSSPRLRRIQTTWG